ncbi:MAG: S8 family serine peptidase [Firmicutes bacterium]|nr:S8 family serine peptidase [Bacillota bacterium]MBQ9605288.1 S8 family serine peptidase [Bacillota bacterium]
MLAYYLDLGVNTGLITLILKYRGDFNDIPRGLYISAEDLGSGFALAEIPPENAAALAADEHIIYAETDKLLSFQELRESTGYSYYCRGDAELLGNGVVIGIIDGAVDVSHPVFADVDIEYYGNTENASTRHGTAVAGVAAQLAPRAKLICAGINETGTDFARASEIMRAAALLVRLSEGRPLVINISYGTNDGSHTGDSLFEEYLDSIAQNELTAIVAATGNLGDSARHFRGVSDGAPVIAEIGVTVPVFSIGIWKNFADDFIFQLTAPNNETYTLSNVSGRFYFHGSIFSYKGAPTPYSVNDETFLRFENAEQGIWKAVLYPRTLATRGNVNMWLSDNIFTAPEADTTITLPAFARRIITAAAYNAAENTAAVFSGRGFAADGLEKPDIAAPGVNIYTAAPDNGFAAYSGTSFAAPFVSAACAALMEWGIVRGNDPFLYGERLKAFLRKGAQRLPNVNYPNTQWGYGSLCLENTVEALRKETGK